MKRILFISHRIPYPPNKGDKIRSFHELKFLSKHFRVDLVTFVENHNDSIYKKELNKYCENIYLFKINKISSLIMGSIFLLIGRSISEGFYYSRKVKKTVEKLIKSNAFQFVFCFSSQIAQYIPFEVEQKIMDFCDVDSDKWKQYSKKKVFPMNLIYQIESKRLGILEKKIASNFSLNMFSTKQELNIFKPEKNNNYVLSNGVDIDYYSPNGQEKEQSIVFVGAMDYFANVDAVVWFAHNVFPDLSKKFSDLKFYIVGNKPVNEVKKLGLLNKNITVTGFVEDVRPFLNKAKISVIPLQISRGIQNKVLEAMAMKLSVVIPDTIYKSLKNLKKDDVIVYNDVDHLIQLLSDYFVNEQKYQGMGKNLRDYVIRNYDWDENLLAFKNHLVNLGIW